MIDLEQAQERIKKEIDNIRLPSEPSGLYDPVRYTLGLGGKRIRPALVLLGANLFSENIDDAIGPAIGIEIFHNFTLLHDDLMDNSEIRRGQKTVHLKWNPNTAILSGDVMSILANEFVCKTASSNLKEILQAFNRTAIEVCEGQMYDMDFESRTNVTISEYLEMIRLKTSVLIAASLEIGALSTNATKNQAKDLYEYGLNLGMAFQLQDDLLDSYGDTKSFGKKVGNDILTNKKTYLMISALNESSSADKKHLIKILAEKNFIPEKKIKDVKLIFDKYFVKELIQNKIDTYFQIALKKLSNISIEENRKSTLQKFSQQLMGRDF